MIVAAVRALSNVESRVIECTTYLCSLSNFGGGNCFTKLDAVFSRVKLAFFSQREFLKLNNFEAFVGNRDSYVFFS